MPEAQFRKPDRSSPMPLWAQILEDLRVRLASGEFETGFPPERELFEQYGTSRHTLRDAMRRLHAEGLISRERGRGTFMNRPAIEQRSGARYSLFHSIEDQGFEQRSIVIALEKRVDAAIATQMELPAATKLIYLRRVRHADETPIATDEIWLNGRIAAPLLKADFQHTSVYTELEQRCGTRPGAGWERVRPALPNVDEATQLGIDPAAPVFVVERFTRAAQKPLEWRRTVIRGDLYSFYSEWNDVGSQVDQPTFNPST